MGNKLNKRILYFLINRNLSNKIKKDLVYIINILKDNYKQLKDIL